MNPEQFAYPFGVGMLAAFNPCGFAMLPTYLGYFVGTAGGESTRLRAVTRAMWVASVLTLGFVAVFGGLGLGISLFLEQATVLEYIGWITVGVGVGLIVMGVAMLSGRDVILRLPKPNTGTGSRETASVLLFGISYAVVSLSCTIGLFIGAVSHTFTADGFWTGVGSFVAYALGMGAVVLFLTVSLARARHAVSANMRRVLPHIGRISGAVVVVGGIYLIDYGIWDIRVLLYDNTQAGNLLVDRFLEFQAAVSNWIADATPKRLGVASALGLLGLLLVAWRDDNPDDHAKRRSLTALTVLAFLAVEARYDFDFVALPLWRFVSNWPQRIGHWFTDPWRWGVPLEILLVALALWWMWVRADRYRRRRVCEPAGTS